MPDPIKSKKVCFLDFEDCFFEKVSETVNGKLVSKLIICHNKDQFEIKLDATLKSEQISNGLEIFSKGNQE